MCTIHVQILEIIMYRPWCSKCLTKPSIYKLSMRIALARENASQAWCNMIGVFRDVPDVTGFGWKIYNNSYHYR